MAYWGLVAEDARRRRKALALQPPLPEVEQTSLQPPLGPLAVPTGTTEKPPEPGEKPWYMKGPSEIPGVQKAIDVLSPPGSLSRTVGSALTTPLGQAEGISPAEALQRESPVSKVLMGLPVGAPVGSLAGTAGRGVLPQLGAGVGRAIETGGAAAGISRTAETVAARAAKKSSSGTIGYATIDEYEAALARGDPKALAVQARLEGTAKPSVARAALKPITEPAAKAPTAAERMPGKAAEDVISGGDAMEAVSKAKGKRQSPSAAGQVGKTSPVVPGLAASTEAQIEQAVGPLASAEERQAFVAKQAAGGKPPIKPPEPRQETETVASIAQSGKGDVPSIEAVAWKDFAASADPSGAPPVRRPPTAKGAKPPGDEPDDIFEAVRNQATKGETISETLLRRHEAAITTAENEARILVDEGVKRFRAAGLGAIRQGRWVPEQKDVGVMDELFEALHNPSKVAKGETKIPVGMEGEYSRLRGLTNWEESMRLDFDPAMATVEDYFYRGWIVPKEGAPAVAQGVPRGRLGSVPSFKKPRVDATYREMRDAGFEPISWNPYEQGRISRLQGVRYRQQMQLVDHLKKLDLAMTDASGLAATGWRTPKVGPAFEGKVFATTDATGQPVAMYSRRWVVPDELAGSLENMYGITHNLGNVHVGNRTFNLSKAIDAVVFIPKRIKLFGSVFQQMDFLTRSYVGAWSGMVDALMAGRPIEAARRLAVWPKSAADIVSANFRPGARAAIRVQLNSTTPLLKDRPGIHLRGIMEGGLSTIDTTILPSNLDQVARVVAEEAGLLGNKAVRRAIGSMESSMRRGLFEGVYPAAQIADIKNNIAPMLVRRYGSLSDEALNGMIAKVTNKKYSTIPASQSVLQNRPLREILRRVFFSISESEGLLRQATGAIRGPEAGYWREHWLGAYLGLIALASAIHYASTGEALPFDRWSPISKDKWGPLPVGYNPKFASPDLPIKGTEGRNNLLDIVGQLDTAFRILDPPGFLASRESVPIRAFTTQVTERDYFGRPIDTVGPGGIYSRTANLINDMFAPIGVGQAAGQIALQAGGLPKGLIPLSERGLGTKGQLVQATGLNLRAQYLRDLWPQDDFKAYDAYFAIPSNDQQVLEETAKATGGIADKFTRASLMTRQRYRTDHPDVEAKLFIVGQVESLSTNDAFDIAVRLMKENGIGIKDIPSLAVKKYEAPSRTKLRAKFELALGTKTPTPVTPKAAVAPTPTQPISSDAYREAQRTLDASIAALGTPTPEPVGAR